MFRTFLVWHVVLQTASKTIQGLTISVTAISGMFGTFSIPVTRNTLRKVTLYQLELNWNWKGNQQCYLFFWWRTFSISRAKSCTLLQQRYVLSFFRGSKRFPGEDAEKTEHVFSTPSALLSRMTLSRKAVVRLNKYKTCRRAIRGRAIFFPRVNNLSIRAPCEWHDLLNRYRTNSERQPQYMRASLSLSDILAVIQVGWG